jgi:hypothetical protein
MKFNTVTHTYSEDGVDFASVSKILECNPIGQKLWEYKASGKVYPAEDLQKAIDHGHRIHELATGEIKGNKFVGENTVKDSETRRLLKCAMREVNRHLPLAYEIPMISMVHGFGGTPDYIGDMGSSVGRIKDWKTNVKSFDKFNLYSVPKYSVQLGAYYILGVENLPYLSEEFGIKDIHLTGDIVHLHSETTVEVNLVKGASDFLRLLDIYKGEEYKGLKVKNAIELWNNGMEMTKIAIILGKEHELIGDAIQKYSIY